MKTLFSDQDLADIKKAIEAAEKSTSGEISVHVKNASSSYSSEIVFACFYISFFILTIIFFFVGFSVYYPLAIIIFGIILNIVARRCPKFFLNFVLPSWVDNAVSEAALFSFYESGLNRTKDKTGILIFISLLEKEVCILGDKGINDKLPQDHWEESVKKIVQGIKKGEATKAVIDVVNNNISVLEKHFPAKPDNFDEIPNDVIIKD